MTLPKYPKYQKTDVKWLGDIPSHWEFRKAKVLFQKLNRIPNLGDKIVTCFRDGVVTLRENRRTKGFTESLKELGYQGIKKGDLVIHVMDAFAGAVGVSDSDGKGTPVYSVCAPKIILNSHYYAFIIREMARSGYITSLTKGIRERSTDFRFETFSNLFLPLPSFKEQKQIASFLEAKCAQINRLTQKKKRLIELLKEYKQAIINQAVTRGLDPNVPLKPSGFEWLVDIPSHWEVKKLKYLFDERNQKGFPTEPLLAATQTHGVITKKNYDKRTVEALKDIEKLKLAVPGDFVISLRSFQGGIEYTHDRGIISPAYNILIPLQEVIPSYFCSLFKSQRFLFLLSFCVTGIREGQNINFNMLKQIKMPLPKPQEQKQIASFLDEKCAQINRSISACQKEITLIEEYRTRLISDVVTGQIDVRHIDIGTTAQEECVEETCKEEPLELVGAGHDH